jgi:hypothetical protein
MQTASAGLIAASTAWPRAPRNLVSVSWDGVNLWDETGFVYEGSQIQGIITGGAIGQGKEATGPTTADTSSWVFNNETKRFSAAGGSLVAYIGTNGGYGKPVAIDVGMVVAGGGVEYCRQLLGVLTEPKEIVRPGPRQVAYEALSMVSKYANQKAYTALQINKRADEYITLLASLLVPAPPSIICDYGLEVYPYLWADGESPWQDMTDVAAAEGGRVFLDKDGNLRFHNYLHLAQTTSPQATITYNDFRSVVPEWDYPNVWNRVTVTYRQRYMAGLQTVWTAGDVIEVPPGSTITQWAQFGQPAYGLLQPVASTDYTARTASYVDKTTDLTITIPANEGDANRYGQRVLVTLTNANATLSLYAENLQLRGYPVLSGAERTIDVSDTSIVPYERLLPINNIFIQSETAADAIARSLLARYRAPRQMARVLGLRGLPYLEVGDRLHLDDTVGTGLHGDYYVAEIQWRCSRHIYEQDLVLVDAASLVPYSNYFWVGTDDAHSTALGTVGRYFF